MNIPTVRLINLYGNLRDSTSGHLERQDLIFVPLFIQLLAEGLKRGEQAFFVKLKFRISLAYLNVIGRNVQNLQEAIWQQEF